MNFFFSSLMKQMSNSLHLKQFVSSLKIHAPHPGAVPCWGWPSSLGPCELGGPWCCLSGRIPGFMAPEQSQQACFRGGWNKGGWNSQFVNLMDPPRLLTAPAVKKDEERGAEKTDSAFLAWYYYSEASVGWGPLWQNKESTQTSVGADGGSRFWMNQKLLTF